MYSIIDDGIRTMFFKGRKQITYFFIVSIFLSMINITMGGVYGGGSGTAEDPYLMGSAENIIELTSTPEDWDKHFVLTTDIDLDGYQQITPIGLDETAPFSGVFDGNGYTVSNITYPTYVNVQYGGFFGYATGISEIKNLRLVRVNANNAYCEHSFGGLLAYNADGAITNCSVMGDISAGSPFSIGGLVGYNSGTITNSKFNGHLSSASGSAFGLGGLVGENAGNLSGCNSAGSVLSAGSWSTVGGLVGRNYTDANVITSDFTGAVSGDSDVGGLIGCNVGGTIAECYAAADVSGTERVGGLIGGNGNYANAGGSVTNCHSSGEVSGDGAIGGLIGENREGAVIRCYSDSKILGLYILGGLIGKNGDSYRYPDGGKIENCYATGIITGGSENSVIIGGLIGSNNGNEIINSFATGAVNSKGSTIGGLVGENYSTITNCHAKGNVSGFYQVGGLVGSNGEWWSLGYEIRNCYATGNIIATGDYVGGFVGYNFGNIRKCYATGSVMGLNSSGGLCGFHGWWQNPQTIEESWAIGHVYGSWETGGLIGWNYCGYVINSYAFSNVSADGNRIGGLVGYNTFGVLTNSYSVGYVMGDANVGGAVGYDYQGTFANVFWDTEKSGLEISAGGTGKTTAEMKQQLTFTGWDFEIVWDINEGINYPQLLWQQSQPPEPVPGDITGDGKVDFADFSIVAEHWLEGL